MDQPVRRSDRGRLIASDQNGPLYRITPPVPLGKADETRVEKLDLSLGGAHGLLYAFDSLYVMVNEPVEKGGVKLAPACIAPVPRTAARPLSHRSSCTKSRVLANMAPTRFCLGPTPIALRRLRQRNGIGRSPRPFARAHVLGRGSLVPGGGRLQRRPGAGGLRLQG